MASPTFFSNSVYQRAYATLLSGIHDHKGFFLLTGERGTGKTTLVQRLMQDAEAVGSCVYLDGSNVLYATIDDVLSFLCTALELSSTESDGVEKLRMLSAHLHALMRNGRTAVLFIDEAQRLNDEVLGGLRMLAAVDKTGTQLLLQIVLVGQPALEQRLTEPDLRPIFQRVALRCRLTGLTEDEVAAYLVHRVHAVGGGRRDLFDADAVSHIARASQGIPRLIDHICHQALLFARDARCETVSAQMVEEAVTALRLRDIPESGPSSIDDAIPVVSRQEEHGATPIPPRKWRRLTIEVLLALGAVLMV
ncbi:MAG: AAA family ATPase [Deltaproteobacteria bacterium]|nr:AAA family ATPase [Deltaproteobacteria bacterium]